MPYLRAIIRLLSIIVTTIVLYAIYLLGSPLFLLTSDAHISWRSRTISLWARCVMPLLGMRLTVNGDPPTPPFFLVSNHLSYLDIVPFFAHTRCVFVAKSEVRSWPVLGFIARTINVIFINRELRRDIPRVNQKISSAIGDRQGVILFPEGTSTQGEHIKPFRSSLLHYPADQQVPVTYAAIRYTVPNRPRLAGEKICWWGDMTFADHFFNVLKLEYFEATVTFGEGAICEENRKELASQLHHQVSSIFEPTTKP